MKKAKKILFLFFTVVFLVACSEYNKILKSKDLKIKYEAAVKYYEDGEYLKAYPLLEELTIIYRGTSKGELLQYYLAYSDYHLGDLLLASYKFKNFAKTFPNSKYAEECLFMSAYCHYRNSPNKSLDQTNTKKAIAELQLFVNRFPTSTRVDSCNKLMDILTDKIEEKEFNIAKQYLQTKNYKSAIVAFDNLLEDYPGTKFSEEAMYLLVKASYFLAVNSVEAKKQERIDDTKDRYIKFVNFFPNSDLVDDAKQYYDKVVRISEKEKKQKG